MASTTKFIEVERHDGGVGLIRLNRPHKLNAWHGAMRDEIIATLQAFDADAGIRAMIMTGAGERAFSARTWRKRMASTWPPARPGSAPGNTSIRCCAA